LSVLTYVQSVKRALSAIAEDARSEAQWTEDVDELELAVEMCVCGLDREAGYRAWKVHRRWGLRVDATASPRRSARKTRRRGRSARARRSAPRGRSDRARRSAPRGRSDAPASLDARARNVCPGR